MSKYVVMIGGEIGVNGTPLTANAICRSLNSKHKQIQQLEQELAEAQKEIRRLQQAITNMTDDAAETVSGKNALIVELAGKLAEEAEKKQ